jgi:glycopeptide antibiotics resistance protein
MDPAPSAPPSDAAEDRSASSWRERRDRGIRRRRRGQAAALLLAYVTLIGLITLTPESVDRGVYPRLMRGVLFLQHHGLPGFRYSMIEEVANVGLFVPLGMLGVLAFGTPRWWLAVLAGTALSASVELAQALFLPARVASVTDVAANGAGALVGATTAVVIAARTRRRGRLRS